MDSGNGAEVMPYWRYPSFKDQIREEGEAYSAKWRIHYVAASGELTVRTILISHFFVKGNTVHILAFCTLRSEERAFRLANVQRAYDLASSRRIENPTDHVVGERAKARRVTLEQSRQDLVLVARDLVDHLRHRSKTRKKRASAARVSDWWSY